MLLAAPFILELESGTYRLAWTQSITRRRWLVGKLRFTLAGALLAMLAMTALMTWWRAPLDQLNGRIAPNSFDFEGTVGFAYVLFAIGLTLAVGVLWRRAVPALMGGFVGYAVARVFVQRLLRQHYATPLTSTWLTSKHGPDLNRAWVINLEPSTRHGDPLAQTVGGLAQRGAAYTHAVYQPASRFWAFQGIETALFGGIGVTLILFAAWWVNERMT